MKNKKSMKGSVKKGVALFCTVFILLSSGYAQSNRVGVFVIPQGNFLGTLVKEWKLDLSRKEKGLLLGEGIYYEKCGDLSAFTVGMGFTQLRNTYTSDSIPGSKGTKQMDFVNILLSGTTNFYDGDQFKVGVLYGLQFHYLLKGNQDGLKMDFTDKKAYERLALTFNLGVNFTYLFTDNIGISVIPSASLFGRSTEEEPSLYWAFGGQVRFFFAFGN